LSIIPFTSRRRRVPSMTARSTKNLQPVEKFAWMSLGSLQQ
jgi:hypothetical protein